MITLYASGKDDTDSINAALLSYRTVNLVGNFITSDSIVLDSRGNNLLGISKYLTSITVNDPNNLAITVIYGSTATGSFSVENISLYCNQQNLTDLVDTIQTRRATGIKIFGHGSKIKNVNIYDAGITAIIVGQSIGVVVEYCHAENIGYISFDNGDTERLGNNIIAGGNAITLDHCYYSRISYCTAKNFRDEGMTLWMCNNSKIDHCVTDGAMLASSTTNARGAFTIEAGAENNILEDCISYNSQGGAVQITGNNNIVRRVDIINHTGLALAAGTDSSTAQHSIHNVHITDINVDSINANNGMVIGKIEDTLSNTNVTVENVTLSNISGAVSYGIDFNKIASGWLKNSNINCIDGSQVAVSFHGFNSSPDFLIESVVTTGKSNYAFEIRDATGIELKTNIINGTKNAAFALFNSDSTVINGNVVKADSVNNQTPYYTVRMDEVSNSLNCIIKNNTFSDYTYIGNLGIFDQNGASSPTLESNK
jgi:hypothetical protein